jgi:hypothetical protein
VPLRVSWKGMASKISRSQMDSAVSQSTRGLVRNGSHDTSEPENGGGGR